MNIPSALFYAVSSFMMSVVNKIVFTSFRFPSYQMLGLGQMLATIIIIGISGRAGFRASILTDIWPLPLIFVANVITGLGGTKELSLPMFTALRRFSILMTMVLERIVLGVNASIAVHLSVCAMICGALIASFDDLTFSASGYTLVLLNDLFTAVNGVYTKKRLDSKKLDKFSLMYYNSLIIFAPCLAYAWLTGDIEETVSFQSWKDLSFVAFFILSCVMGVVLSYSIMVCTQYNSALTTTIIGCLKNIFVTYVGMQIGGDYVFSWINFIGLNISMVGSLIYAYVTFKKRIVINTQQHLLP